MWGTLPAVAAEAALAESARCAQSDMLADELLAIGIICTIANDTCLKTPVQPPGIRGGYCCHCVRRRGR